MTRHVVVVGSGVAGTAAALAATRAGASVTMLAGAAGASVLTTGALDDVPWEDATDDAAALGGDVVALLELLGGYAVPASRYALVASTAGVVRRARATDTAVFDLATLPPGPVLVPRSEHHGWDATVLARAWTESTVARERGTTFVAADAQITRFRDERTLRDAEIAARHDDPQRIGWLADRLREALSRGGPFAGVVLPPWLGIVAPRARALSERAGVPCGEAIAGLAGAPGLRFENARDRALAAAGVDVVRAWVESVRRAGEHWSIRLHGGDAGARHADPSASDDEAGSVDDHDDEPAAAAAADAVVLATGGLVGGGLAYEPGASAFATAVPTSARPTFRPAVAAPGTVGAHGRPLDLPGSLFGVPPEALAWPFARAPLLERAGLLVGADGRVTGAAAGLYAAGELVADRPRTWLAAFIGGLRAGAAAAASRHAADEAIASPYAG